MPRLLLLNNIVLFVCCSIYLGTGVSLVFFQLPLEPQLTVENYYLIFVEPVQYATSFFTNMTILMLITGLIMLASEWVSGLRWPPIIVLLGAIAGAVIGIVLIFPLNQELTAGVTDNARLAAIFEQWTDYNRIRALVWVVQWFAMMYYFYALALKARADR